MRKLCCLIDSEVHSCGWYSNGKVVIDCYSAKDTYLAGEAMTILANINSQSTKDVNEFTVQLISALIVRAGPHLKTIEETVSEEVWQAGLLSKHKISGIEVFLPIPESVQQQTFGTKIRHYYYVEITGAISWASDAECKIPVYVFVPSPDVTAVAVPGPPSNWTPRSPSRQKSMRQWQNRKLT